MAAAWLRAGIGRACLVAFVAATLTGFVPLRGMAQTAEPSLGDLPPVVPKHAARPKHAKPARAARPAARIPAPAPPVAVAPAPIPIPPKPPPPPSLPPPIVVPTRPPSPPLPATVMLNAPGEAMPGKDSLRLTFGPDVAALNPATDAAIRKLAHGVSAKGSGVSAATDFTVTAFAAAVPDDPSAARRLSLSRALAVRSVLINEGVTSVHIYVKALGAPPLEDKPADRVDIVASPNAPTTKASQ